VIPWTPFTPVHSVIIVSTFTLSCRSMFCDLILSSEINVPHFATLPSHTKLLCLGSEVIMHEGVSKSSRTGRLERELQMVQLSVTGCSCIAILWVSLVRFVVITLCVASQRVFIVVYFVIYSVRRLLDTPSYIGHYVTEYHSNILFCYYRAPPPPPKRQVIMYTRLIMLLPPRGHICYRDSILFYPIRQ
jgi:hypothetical protein